MIGNWFDALGQSTAERVINGLLVVALTLLCIIAAAILGGLFGWLMA